ncbi:3-dehydroquinate synthase, partial [Candidatus Pelagibacter sp.]|nr:3-dehydroquinate synthase [Candidatus Pelagibacter sp.]
MKLVKLLIKTKSSTYPVVIGSNLITNLTKIFKENLITYNKCLLVIDKNVPSKMINKISETMRGKVVFKYSFNASEKNKNQKNVDKILDILLSKNFSRQDCLIAVGGGITGDVSGYAASIYKRGLQFVNIPTTLLSQVDSSVGGKTGINTKHGKNLIGSFFQPKIVISDSSFLKTLPHREIICGYGEILKHSLIVNEKFFSYLNRNATNILKLKTPYIEKAIFESCKIKKTVVEKDENEKNLRKILNFGHTFAHAYEATLNFSRRLNHGEAVILGIVTALKFSLKNKYIKEQEFISVINHIKKFKMP